MRRGGAERRLGEAEYLWLEKGLKAIGLFSALDLKGLSGILPYIRLHEHPKGDVLCREGEEGDRFYLIYRGKVEVLKEGGVLAPGRFHVAYLGPGQFFGEMALLFKQPRTATCVAKTASRIFSLSFEDFERLVGRHPEMRSTLRKTASKRMKALAHAGHH